VRSTRMVIDIATCQSLGDSHSIVCQRE